MNHPRLALTAALFCITTVAAASAASLPSGTINCTVVPADANALRFHPFIDSNPSTRRITLTTNMKGTCDNSGVSGGKAPITNVEAKLTGKLAIGTNCTSFVSAPHFDRLKVTVKWKTLDEGRLKTVASNTVRFVDATWDDDTEAVVMASQPLKGAFAGSTSTVTLTLDTPENFNAMCPPIEGVNYGADNGSSITIP